MATLNFFMTYVLASIWAQQTPRATFFRDRYFPTGAGDIFKADKVLTEFRDGDKKLAAFVAPRAGDIPVAREGYEIHEYRPAYIAPSRNLTLDDLSKRGFGEAIYSTDDQQQRAARIMAQDLIDLDARIARREEWMAVQTMINNGCTMQEYVDAKTKGDIITLAFWGNGTSKDHTYTASTKWDAADAAEKSVAYGDIKAMARKLSSRGLPAVDLVLGTDAYDALLNDATIKDELNRNIAFNDATVAETLTADEGVTYIGTLNFGGHRLNVFCADEEYTDQDGTSKKYFPATAAMVTAPNCGHLMYGQITQIDYGADNYTTHVGTRIPKVVVDQDRDIRKLRFAARPLAAPRSLNPYVYAADVVG
jgi:hypothetical protein